MSFPFSSKMQKGTSQEGQIYIFSNSVLSDRSYSSYRLHIGHIRICLLFSEELLEVATLTNSSISLLVSIDLFSFLMHVSLIFYLLVDPNRTQINGVSGHLRSDLSPHRSNPYVGQRIIWINWNEANSFTK